jgi:hypothetical protein
METLSLITAVGYSIIGALCTLPSQKRLSKSTFRFLAAGKEITQRRKISEDQQRKKHKTDGNTGGFIRWVCGRAKPLWVGLWDVIRMT